MPDIIYLGNNSFQAMKAAWGIMSSIEKNKTWKLFKNVHIICLLSLKAFFVLIIYMKNMMDDTSIFTKNANIHPSIF